MNVLFIGGTGTISSACSVRAIEKGIDVTLLNRGQSVRAPAEGAHVLHVDIRDKAAVEQALGGRRFDAVVDWVAFTPDQVQADIDLFAGKTGQYIFISSASAYQTPPANLPIRESTPLENPYGNTPGTKLPARSFWCRPTGGRTFPSPSSVRHTPTTRVMCRFRVVLPTSTRMLHGKPVFVPGDGTSIWTLTHNTDFAKGFVGCWVTRALWVRFSISPRMNG